jgi:ABC-type taurine transport system ATPase subunit
LPGTPGSSEFDAAYASAQQAARAAFLRTIKQRSETDTFGLLVRLYLSSNDLDRVTNATQRSHERALVHEPPLLMMDEPFGALDALTREQMRLDLERLWMETRKTVIFITHSIDEAVLLADRVIVMSPRPGRIERVIDIDIPRPRGFDGRKHPRFLQINDEITEIFLARGVLQRS